MAFFEKDPGGNGELPNIPFPVMDGEVFWDVLDSQGDYRLQQNKVTGHCRILDSNNIRVAWGDEDAMRRKLLSLTGRITSAVSVQYGDVIGVHRVGGLYDHYGVYESDSCVYEYAASDTDFGDAEIHTTTLNHFVRDSSSYFVLSFPEEYGTPKKIDIAHPAQLVGFEPVLTPAPNPLYLTLKTLWKEKARQDYHLYTPEETIQRARGRLGETSYNLAANNCEHYAIWCKTGIHESHQVQAVLDLLFDNGLFSNIDL